MYLIASKEEKNGEVGMSVADAKKTVKKLEELNRIRPNAHNAINLACVYYTLGRGQEALHAIEVVKKAVEELPDPVAALSPQALGAIYLNHGMFLRGHGRQAEAYPSIMKAAETDKSSAYIGMAYAEEKLRIGDWVNGWKVHNQVRGTCDGACLALGLPESCKFWDGKEHPEHLIVINEGGTGDRINYTRYLPLLTERGIKWSFFSFDELHPFYDRLPWIPKEALLGEHDKMEFSPPPSHWITTFALAGPLGLTPETIPQMPTPFTAPKSDFHFNKVDDLPVVGLSWSANELFQGGLKVRSMTEGQAMRLVSMTADKIHWVNLQHDHKMPFPVANIGFESWQDTSVLISSLDAVVSVDCGTMWLSLAMNKPTTVVLSAAEDWKFGAAEPYWSPFATFYHNGESTEVFDIEKAITALIVDIRSGKWQETCLPKVKVEAVLNTVSR